MTLPVLIGVGLAGGVGAMIRFLVAAEVAVHIGGRFPFGTLAVNLSGSFALGVLVGATLHGAAARIVLTGLLGAYTTFSAWEADSRRLAGEGERRLAALNFALSLALGLLAVWLGRELGRAL